MDVLIPFKCFHRNNKNTSFKDLNAEGPNLYAIMRTSPEVRSHIKEEQETEVLSNMR